MNPTAAALACTLAAALVLATAGLSGCHATAGTRGAGAAAPTPERPMQLGNFSVSLAVKDMAASRAFYEKLGFRPIPGHENNTAKNGRGWLILQNDTATIGLFQGMFDKNILTFNPGWDRHCNTLPRFDDVRDIQRSLRAAGVPLDTQADESTTGPASLVVTDPDGNPVLIDQHVPRGKP